MTRHIFRQAYAFGAIRPDEVSRFGAVAATRRTVDFVASALERSRQHAA